MRIIQGLREWWQRQTGEEDTPWDGDSPAFFVSLLVHLGVLVALGLVPVIVENNQITLIVHATPPLEEVVELKLPEKFYFNDHPSVEVGSSSVLGEAAALSLAPVISEVSQVVNHFELEPTALKPTIEINTAVEAATGVHYSQNLAVKGAAGEGTTGAAGAIDRITHEIMLSLEERQTLVVWLLDGTASLAVQRQTICDRFERIHQELGIIEAAGDEAFARREDKPLLSSVIGFGSGMKLMTKKPTDNLAELKQAVLAIDNDDSGVENIFGAVHAAAGLYAEYRYMSANQAEPKRNVMFIVFTDEAGSDPQRAEEAIKLCRRLTMPVYVVGVPAPFGRQETLMKWVDPDPQFDQTPQWGVVEQGPESFRPERIKLCFSG
ncbi:MAG: vWA domain-containing protein [Pirellulaceae bacterium]